MGSEDESFCSRIKSARRRKRLQKKGFDRKLVALHREEKRLSEQIRNLGYEPLVPPIQKGWKRMFVLREDLKKTPRSDFFEELLEKINTVQYSHKKEFKIKRRKRGRKIYVDREQKLQSFYDYSFFRLKLTPEQAFYFIEVIVLDHKGREYKMYEFNEPWRFVLKIVPNVITKIKVKDDALEQKMAEVKRYLDSNHLYPKLWKVIGWRYNPKAFRCESPKYDNPLQNKPLHTMLAEFYDEN
jgi:hypothetical protein